MCWYSKHSQVFVIMYWLRITDIIVLVDCRFRDRVLYMHLILGPGYGKIGEGVAWRS